MMKIIALSAFVLILSPAAARADAACHAAGYTESPAYSSTEWA